MLKNRFQNSAGWRLKQRIRPSRNTLVLMFLAVIIMATSGCVYYNTFYHARRWFNQAESSRKKANRDLASSAESRLYQDAIRKASKVLAEHPNSSWVDDALFVIGKSFYHLGDNSKAERKFRELLSSFPESKYAEESRFYLGKSRYRLQNYAQAREVFLEFLKKKSKDEWQSEALYLMGELNYEQENWSEAIEYYNQFVERYKSDPNVSDVLFRMGQLHWELEDFASAAKAYEASSRSTIDKQKIFAARYEFGRALYQMDTVEAGLALFRQLEKEQSDSIQLGKILLRVAEGLHKSGRERSAILLYDDIGTGFSMREEGAEAYCRLGLILQDEWRDLDNAKDMYQRGAAIQRGGEWRVLALEKLNDIAKIETYRAQMSSESVEEAVQSRFLLAELYHTTLESPDSALSEYESLMENFPESDLAPKALLAIGWLYESQFHDTSRAHTYYERVLDEYPKSDHYGAALKLLGRTRDSYQPYQPLHPGRLYAMAEERFLDVHDLDSARVLYERLVEEFPTSELVPRAEFAIAKIKLAQFIPSKTPPTERPQALTAPGGEVSVQPDTASPGQADADSLSEGTDSLAVPDSATTVSPSQSPDTSMTVPPTPQSRTTDSAPSPIDLSSKELTGHPDSAMLGGETDRDIRLTDLIGGAQTEADDTPGSQQRLARQRAKARADSLRALDSLARFDSAAVTGQPVDLPLPIDTTGMAVSPDSLRVDSVTALPAEPAPPIDSTMIWEFLYLAEKYAGTPIGNEAARLASGELKTPSRPQRQQQQMQQQRPQQPDTVAQRQDTTITPSFADTLSEAQLAETRLREEIDLWPLMQYPPIVVGEFNYPIAASTSRFEGRVVLKIKIEFEGKVSEVIFLKGTNHRELDLAIEKAMLETFFDPLKIEPLQIGGYFIYNYDVVLPEVYR